jgi:multidrug efflux pump subunit AcrB
MTVAVAVLFSLLVARLITPMMAAYLMRPVPEKPHSDGALMRFYTRFLTATLRWRYLTLVTGVLLFSGSIYATTLLPTGFLPEEDTSRVVVAVELPPGTQLDETSAKTDHMVRILRTIPEVEQVFVLGGTSPTGQLDVRRASLFVKLAPKTKRKLTQTQLKTIIAAKLADVPDSRAWYINERGERELSFSMLSRNGEDLNRAIGKVEGALRSVPGFRNVAATGSTDRPEIHIVPRLDEAARLGVAPEKISETIRVATIGDADFNLAKYTVGDRQVPIRVQLDEATRTDLKRLEQLRVTNMAGKAIPLTAVAAVEFGRGPASIERFDRLRRAVVGVDLDRGMPLSVARARFLKVIEDQNLPATVTLQPSGDAEVQDEVANGFITAMGTGILIVLGLLILLFGSVFQPVTILLSLPLSFGGVALSLLVTDNSISMPVYIGLLMLMGIVTKNAIMLVDFAIEEIANGVERREAIIDAGRKRARPIIMTTLAMAAGMLPSAFALGDGGEFRAPMAIAVIGGLLVSTLLSLIFVPSFFTVMDDFGWLMQRIFGRFVGPRDEPETAPRPAGTEVPRPNPLPLAAE